MAPGRRYTDNPNVKALVFVTTIPIFVLYTLAITGCVSNSPGIPNLFLFRILTQSDGAELLRVGYIGVCGKTGSSVNCASGVGKSVTNLTPALFPGKTNNDTLSVLQFALVIQNKIILPVIIAGGVTFMLGVLSLLNLKRQERKMLDLYKASSVSQPLRRLPFLTIFLLWLSVTLAFGASLSSNISVGALAFTTDSFKTQFSIQTGKALQAIQWTNFTFVLLLSAGVTEMLWTRNGYRAGSSYNSSRRHTSDADYYPDAPREGGSPPY